DGSMKVVAQGHGRLVGTWAGDDWVQASGWRLGSPDYARYLVGMDGEVRPLDGLGGTLSPAGTLLVSQFSVGEGYERTQQVQVLDPVTGATSLLTDGSAVKVYLDPDRSVVGWVKRAVGSGPTGEWSLWRGAVPTP
ncbi:MAG TPA: hypothetical protein VGD74_02960, partial [Vulgatibacter sp.]